MADVERKIEEKLPAPPVGKWEQERIEHAAKEEARWKQLREEEAARLACHQKDVANDGNRLNLYAKDLANTMQHRAAIEEIAKADTAAKNALADAAARIATALERLATQAEKQ